VYHLPPMAGDAARHYAEMVDAVARQRERLLGETSLASRWDRSAPGDRFDPLRPLDANLEVVASYIRPGDTLIDVGGGAGRVGLPLARRCAHLTNVEPSEGMGRAFLALASEAAITNVTLVQSPWESSPEVVADVVMSADVTYFVAGIVPFIARLQRSAHRRVVLWTWSVPPPNLNASLFELVFGEPKAPVPGYRELLAVLDEMGIAAENRPLPEPFTWPESRPTTVAQAVKFALQAVEAPATPTNVGRVEAALPQLFTEGPAGFEPAWRPRAEGLLLTWGPDPEGGVRLLRPGRSKRQAVSLRC
ncbi:MAG: class I SAM-dependent methyltransferase, partial [Tepidiformaceae bacterium]